MVKLDKIGLCLTIHFTSSIEDSLGTPHLQASTVYMPQVHARSIPFYISENKPTLVHQWDALQSWSLNNGVQNEVGSNRIPDSTSSTFQPCVMPWCLNPIESDGPVNAFCHFLSKAVPDHMWCCIRC